MAEYYSAELSQKIRRGMRESAYKCQVVGGYPALGYKAGPDNLTNDKKTELLRSVLNTLPDKGGFAATLAGSDIELFGGGDCSKSEPPYTHIYFYQGLLVLIAENIAHK